MKPICENCIHWENGECELKLRDYRTSANHECDEVMFLFDFVIGEGPTLFFEPYKTNKNIKLKNL